MENGGNFGGTAQLEEAGHWAGGGGAGHPLKGACWSWLLSSLLPGCGEVSGAVALPPSPSVMTFCSSQTHCHRAE